MHISSPHLFVSLILMMMPLLDSHAAESNLRWSRLPALPDAEGFAAPFTGVSRGALIVAGGANIPLNKYADVFTKVWYDQVFVLEQPDAQWKTGFQLPRPLGYGISVSADDSVWCFGGSDATQHYSDGFRLQWTNGKIETTKLPSLPKPCANACGALVGRSIYIAGGIETPASTVAMHNFWALDLDAKELKWRELEPWPGPARMLAVAGVYDGSFFLFSGASLAAGADGKASRTFLRDAYRFTPSKGWQRIAHLPRAAVAAPSPAAVLDSQLLVVTGDDGLNVTFQPIKDHPGFPRETLYYNAVKDTWSTQGDVPFSLATAPTVMWQSRYVIPNGEVRPRLRTPEVWSLDLP